MADFFSRLTERTLGMASLVTPLITPITAPGSALAVSEEAFRNQQNEADVFLATTNQSLDLPDSSESPDASTSVKPGGVSALTHKEMMTSESAARAVEPEPLAYRPSITSIDSDKQLHNGNSLPQDHSAKDRGDLSQGQNPQPVISIAEVTRKAQVPGQRLQLEPSGSGSSITLEAEAHALPAAKTVLKPSEPLTVHPVTTPYRKAAPSESRRFEQEPLATPPVVQVTIGRIEVRAVMAPTSSPPKQTVPVNPRLSLADYLSQRNQGKR